MGSQRIRCNWVDIAHTMRVDDDSVYWPLMGSAECQVPPKHSLQQPKGAERLLWARPPFSLKTAETLGKVKFQEANMPSQPANSWFTIGTQLCLSTQPQLVGNQDPRTGRGSAGQLPPPFCLSLSNKLMFTKLFFLVSSGLISRCTASAKRVPFRSEPDGMGSGKNMESGVRRMG